MIWVNLRYEIHKERILLIQIIWCVLFWYLLWFVYFFRPYIIVERGEPLVKQQHIDELKQGIRKFQDLLNDGKNLLFLKLFLIQLIFHVKYCELSPVKDRADEYWLRWSYKKLLKTPIIQANWKLGLMEPLKAMKYSTWTKK